MSGIRYAEDGDRLALKEMWKLCFSIDTDVFIDFYFDHVYRNEETLIHVENNIPVASLQILPYQIKLKQRRFEAGYISGAMTHPDFRRKGYMERLLIFAFEEMKKKNISFTFLIPQENWLFDFYAKYGYQKAFPACTSKRFDPEIPVNTNLISDDCKINIYNNFNDIEIDYLYAVYSYFLEQKENVVLKTRRQFSNLLCDFFMDDGILFANEKGITFAFENNENILLKEFFYTDEPVRNAFLNKISSYFLEKEIFIIDANQFSSDHFFGMIKVLDETDFSSENIYMSMMLD